MKDILCLRKMTTFAPLNLQVMVLTPKNHSFANYKYDLNNPGVKAASTMNLLND